jgi:hypothetical protein
MSRHSSHDNALSPIETLEPRNLFTVTVAFAAPDMLIFTGDAAPDTTYIYDNGNGTIQGSRTGPGGVLVPFGPFPGIRNIYHSDTGTTNDRVFYNLIGDVPAGSVRKVNISPGAGDDFVQFAASNDIDTAVLSSFNLIVYAGNGNDYVLGKYSGELDGHLHMSFDGGDGNDRLITNATLHAGSTGSLFARSWGQNGDDNIDMHPRKLNPADPVSINASASGGAHVFGDKLSRTALAFNDATFEAIVVVL